MIGDDLRTPSTTHFERPPGRIESPKIQSLLAKRAQKRATHQNDQLQRQRLSTKEKTNFRESSAAAQESFLQFLDESRRPRRTRRNQKRAERAARAAGNAADEDDEPDTEDEDPPPEDTRKINMTMIFEPDLRFTSDGEYRSMHGLTQTTQMWDKTMRQMALKGVQKTPNLPWNFYKWKVKTQAMVYEFVRGGVLPAISVSLVIGRVLAITGLSKETLSVVQTL